MNRLRPTIETARESYRAERYEGDLGELALSSPSQPRRRGRLAVGGLAFAASLLIGLTFFPEEQPTPAVKRELVASSAPTTAPATSPRKPSLLGQFARLSRTREAAARHATQRPSLATATSPIKLGQRARPSTLAFTRPKRPNVNAAALAGRTRPTPPATPATKSLSPPSIGLRSLNDAISLGT